VNEFSFGFGKILWHKKKGHTDYQLRAIPFGGFVEPAGPMFHPQDAKEPPKSYEFAAKPWYAKFFMVINGALFNYVLAAVIFALLVFTQGMPQTDPAKLPAVVGSAVKGYPAEKIGLQEGDVITSINGQQMANWKDVTDALQARTGGDLTVSYAREGKPFTATVTESDFKPSAPQTLGVSVQAAYYKVAWWQAAWYGVYECYYWTKFSLQSLAKSFTQKKAPELAGPIGIVNIIHQAAHRSVVDFVWLIAMLSVAVGMFNLFPIPVLDGGYALVFLWEGITHKLPTEKTLNRAINVGMYLLILLVVYASYSDIKRIFFKPQTAVTQTQADNAENTTEQEQNHDQD